MTSSINRTLCHAVRSIPASVISKYPQPFKLRTPTLSDTETLQNVWVALVVMNETLA